MKTWSINKPCFHAWLAQRSMRANRKPSVKVVNLSCRVSNSLVTGIDQHPCESPEHKSPSFLQERLQENLIYRGGKSSGGVSERAAIRNTLFYHILVLFISLFTHLGVTCSAWSFLGKAEDERLEYTSTERTRRPLRGQYYWCSLCQTECVKCMTSWAKSQGHNYLLITCVSVIIRGSV